MKKFVDILEKLVYNDFVANTYFYENDNFN